MKINFFRFNRRSRVLACFMLILFSFSVDASKHVTDLSKSTNDNFNADSYVEKGISNQQGKRNETVQFFRTLIFADPVVANAVSDQTLAVEEEKTISVENVFTDADEGDVLTLTVSSGDEGIATAILDGNSLKIKGISSGETDITLKATDGNGGEAEDVFKITVPASNTPPVVANAVSDQTLAVEEEKTISVENVFTDADEGDVLTLTVSSGDEGIATAILDGNSLKIKGISSGETDITLKATDGNGGEAEDVFKITVPASNTPPIVANAVSDQTLAVEEEKTISVENVFTDADEGDVLTLTVSSGDEGIATAILDGNSLKIKGISSGETDITLKATDGNGGEAEDVFKITVPASNTPPIVANAVSDQTLAVEEEKTISVENVFTDADEGDVLTLTVSSGDEGIATAILDGNSLKIKGISSGETDITLKATDGNGGEAEDVFKITVPASNTPPIVANAVSDQTLAVEEEKTISVENVFTDADEGDVLTLTVSSGDEGIATAILDGNSLKIKGISSGETDITLKATDGNGGEAEDVFKITVPASNTPPIVANAVSDQTLAVEEEKTISVENVFTDADEGDVLTLTVSSGDEGIAIAVLDGNSLKIKGISSGETDITLKATDGNGGEAEDVFKITVTQDNRPPVVDEFITPQSIEVSETAIIDLGPIFSDPDDDELVYEANSRDDNIVSVEILTGERLQITGVAAGEEIEIEVIASDPDNANARTTFPVTVVIQNAAPVIAFQVKPITLKVGDEWSEKELIDLFKDDDGDELKFKISSLNTSIADGKNDGGTLVIKGKSKGNTKINVEADDNKGGKVTMVIDVKVKDNFPPEATSPIDNMILKVGGDPFTKVLTDVFTDPDGDELKFKGSLDVKDIIELEVSGKNLSITPKKVGGPVIVTLTASDGDLVGSTTFEVSVSKDNQPPKVKLVIRDKNLRVGGSPKRTNLRKHFTDPDGNDSKLKFSIVSNSLPSVVEAKTVRVNGRVLVLTPLSAGLNAKVCVQATDGEANVDACFKVNVYSKADPSKTIIETDKEEIDADGKSTAQITVTVRDKDGNNIPIGKDTIEFNSPTLGTIGSSRDLGNGQYVATLKSSEDIGTSVITAKLNGVKIDDDVKIKFISTGPDPSKSRIFVDKKALIANGADFTKVTVKLYDSGGVPIDVGGEKVNVYSNGGGTITPVPATDNNNGTYSVKLTSSTKTGQVLVYARLNGTSINKAVLVYFIAGPADASKTIIQARDSAILADGVSYTIVTARLFDEFGNKLIKGGNDVKLTTDAGTISVTTDNQNGTYSARLTSSTKVETATIKGKQDGNNIGSSATVKFGTGGVDPAKTIITTDKNEIVADGESKVIVEVKLFDKFGNPVENGSAQVKLSHTPEVLANLGNVINNNNGIYNADLTSNTSIGDVKIKGTVNGVEISDSAMVKLIAGDADPANCLIVSRLPKIAADGVSTTKITVSLRDAYNNLLDRGGDNVKIFRTKGSLTGTVTSNFDGTYTDILTSSTNDETAKLNAEVNGVAIVSFAEVRFVKDVVIVDPSKSVLTVDKNEIIADGESKTDVLLKLYDTSGDSITSGNFDVSFDATLGELIDEIDNGDGTYSAKLKSSTEAGISVVTAHIDGKKVDDQKEVEFVPGPVDVTKCNIIPKDKKIPANEISKTKVIVLLKDKFGNRYKEGGETVNFAASLGSINSDAKDNNDGTYYEDLTSSKTVGISKISGKVGGVSILDTAEVEFYEDLPVDPSKSTITAEEEVINANGVSTAKIIVALFDKNGNQIHQGGDAVSLSTSAGEITFDPIDNDDGTYTGVLTSSTQLDTALIQGTVNDADIGDDAQVIFVKPVVSASKSIITAEQKALPANGFALTLVTVKLLDEDNVPITVGGDDVLLYTSGGIITEIPADGENGTYIGTLTADTVAQIATITGTINGEAIGDIELVEFIVGDPSPKTSVIVSNKKQILADEKSQATITLQLYDEYKNPVTKGGDTITLNATKGGIETPVDNNDGSYTAVLTSTKNVEVSIITGTVNGLSIEDDEEVKFVEKIEIDPFLCLIEAEDTFLLANGISSTLITMTIIDANGDQVKNGGDVVKLLNTKGDFSGLTDQGDGTYTGLLTSEAFPDTAILTGTVNGMDIGDREVVYFVDDFPPDPTTSVIDAEKPKILANGKSKTKIIVTLFDKNGNRVTSGSHSVDLDNKLIGELSSITNMQDGTFEAELTSSIKPDTCVLTGILNGNPMTDVETVVFVSEVVADPSLTLITAADKKILADGKDSTKITLQVYDINGEKKDKGGDDIVLSTSAGTLKNNVPKDEGDGTYTTYLISSNKIEKALITGIINGDDINDDEEVSFVQEVVIIDPKKCTIKAKYKKLPADGISSTVITVQLYDIAGNPLNIGGDDVKLQTDEGTLVLGDANDEGNGTYTDTLIASNKEVDAYVRGYVNGEFINDFAFVEFKHDVVLVDPGQSKIIADKVKIAADGKSTSDITIYLYDSDGNKLTKGGDIVIMDDPKAGTYDNEDRIAKDNGNGTYTITITSSNEVEVASIKGTVNGDKIGDSAEIEFFLDIVADPKTSIIESDKDQLLADGKSEAIISVTLYDTNGDRIRVDANKVDLGLTPNSYGELSDVVFNKDKEQYVATFTAGVETGEVFITGTVNGENIASRAEIELIGEEEGEVEVPQGFSPNGDQINDLLVIPGIIGYPQNKLVIFNRWGSKVFTSTGYSNDWDGQSNGSGTFGNSFLPNGTYFYVLDLGIGKEPIKGYFYISR